MHCCNNLNDSYTVNSIQEIPDLDGKLAIASSDIEKHSAIFRCDGCGKLWVVENLGRKNGKPLQIYKKQTTSEPCVKDITL